MIADDVELFRNGLKVLLQQQDEIEMVGEAANGLELLHTLKTIQPDVVITDIEMPKMSGIDVTKRIKAEYPNIPVIALTMFNENHLLAEMLEAGASGYLLKSTSKEELLEGIKAVVAGGLFFCNTTSMKLLKIVAATSIKDFPAHEAEKFSEKEIEIIQLICQEYSSKQIGPQLHLSSKTVQNYRIKIMEKTGAKNIAGLVVYAIKHGLFRME